MVCGVTSETAEFYNRVNTRCKECHKRKVRENRAAKADYYRAYDAQRFQEDPRVRARHKAYRETKAGKEAMARGRKNWLSKNPEKRAAHVILNNAVRDGRVEKPKECQRCGTSKGRIHGHHEDYTKPLDVIWLCHGCHMKEHF
jgi:hypothetical protein